MDRDQVLAVIWAKHRIRRIKIGISILYQTSHKWTRKIGDEMIMKFIIE